MMRNIQRPIQTFLLIVLLASLTSCAPGGSLDKLRHKEARVGYRRVLVNRYSDKVTYYWGNGKWGRLDLSAQAALQNLYEAQKASK